MSVHEREYNRYLRVKLRIYAHTWAVVAKAVTVVVGVVAAAIVSICCCFQAEAVKTKVVVVVAPFD